MLLNEESKEVEEINYGKPKKGLIAFSSKDPLTMQAQAQIREQLKLLMDGLNMPCTSAVFTGDVSVEFIPYSRLYEHGFRVGLPRRRLTLGERIRLLFTG